MTNAKCKRCKKQTETIYLGHRVFIVCWKCLNFTMLHENLTEAKNEWAEINGN